METPDEDWKLIAQDLAIAFGIVAAIVVAIFAVTGSWPPVVVVESGSMMHDDAGYGRVGTIDPGDLIFVQAVGAPDDVATYGAVRDGSGPHAYGRPGEVIIFQGPRSTPIIHRAMAWVQIEETADGALRYTVAAYGIEDAEQITIDELGLEDYRPNEEGFLTQGDAPSNPASDQALGIVREPVRLDQIEGKATGEIPWFGLIKLMVEGNACQRGWIRVGLACAPGDLWVMLGVGLGGLLGTVLVVDQVAMYVEERGIRLIGGEGDDGEDLSTEDPSNPPGKPP